MERHLLIRDNGTISAEKFGAISTLTNGLTIRLVDSADTTLLDFLDGLTIKDNASIGRLCYDVDLKTWGSGDSMILARWTIARAGGSALLYNDRFMRIAVQDDLSSLVEFRVHAQGTSELWNP